MNEIEKQLLRETAGNAEPKLSIRSCEGIDAGRWWRRTPLWLCVTGADLVILAVARRRHAEKTPLATCTSSHYNHSTGELVIAPVENLRFNRFRMPLREAIRLLEILNPASLGHKLQNQ
ncbi:hypothetical protein HZ994_12435 [Akkermansiaceae bacterium]|nr:hypothetical protein HZ994_12435 [Akkermansiaceae bacterium]